MSRFLPALLALAAVPALGEEPGAPKLDTPPQLAGLIAESLSARPRIAAAQAEVRAAGEAIPQAGAWPDPMLQLGVQNDGFSSIEIGRMNTSYVSVGVSQTFPWPGKRRLAREIAAAGKERAGTGVDRARLETEAAVRRAFLDLVLARDRLDLLDRLETLWRQAEGAARTRYEAGEGAQSDLLRAQLERSRLAARRAEVLAQRRSREQELARLTGRGLETTLEPAVHLVDLAPPSLPPDDPSRRSPEHAAARIEVRQAEQEARLARKEVLPDLTVSAAVMPRGGDFPPMWQLGVAGSLPVFAGSKQSRAAAGSEARAAAGRSEAAEIEQQLALASARWRTELDAASSVVKLYRGGLLVQSQATAQSTLAQYQVGRATFASVLEAGAGQVDDEESYLQALASVQRIGIDALENLP